MSGRVLALGIFALALGGTGSLARAQAPSVPANICVTDWGWCHLPSITAPHGVVCVCLTPQNRRVTGVTRFFPSATSPSPYLRPHTGPPTTIR